MTEYQPTLTPEDELSASDRALTSEQRLSKAHNTATRVVIDAHRQDFNKAKADAAAALGIRWVPRKSAAEKALEDVLALIEAQPKIRYALLQELRSDLEEPVSLADEDPDRTEDLSGDPVFEPAEEMGFQPGGAHAGPVDDRSLPATAEIDGLTVTGRVTEDHGVFVYRNDSGDMVRTGDFTLITIEGHEL